MKIRFLCNLTISEYPAKGNLYIYIYIYIRKREVTLFIFDFCLGKRIHELIFPSRKTNF